MVRLTSKKFLNSLSGYIEGDNGARKHDELKGLHIYLGVVHRYVGMFMSRTMSLSNRIRSAAYVTTVLLIWQGWVRVDVPEFNSRNEEAYHRSTDYTYISREAKTDALLSCHFIVLLIKLFRDKFKDLAIPFHSLGSDVCEDVFAALGGFVRNKRTYTIYEALSTIRARLRATSLAIKNDIKLGKRVGGKRPAFFEDEAMSGNQTDYRPDSEMGEDWQAGVEEAKVDCEAAGLKPKACETDGVLDQPIDADADCTHRCRGMVTTTIGRSVIS